MSQNLEFRSKRVQRSVEGFGIGIEMIPLIMGVISALAGMFNECRKEDDDQPVDPVASAKKAKQYVENRFNKNRSKYAGGLMLQTMRKVKAQARKDGKKLNNEQAERLAHGILDDIRNDEPTPTEYTFALSPEGQGFAAKDED